MLPSAVQLAILLQSWADLSRGPLDLLGGYAERWGVPRHRPSVSTTAPLLVITLLDRGGPGEQPTLKQGNLEQPVKMKMDLANGHPNGPSDASDLPRIIITTTTTTTIIIIIILSQYPPSVCRSRSPRAKASCYRQLSVWRVKAELLVTLLLESSQCSEALTVHSIQDPPATEKP
ncbi:unnamed protein product [Gadus morhua 'NCC']